MGATKIMIIRHAERPDQYYGRSFSGVDMTGENAGQNGKKHLITLGWQRAGALVTLFAPPWGPKTPTLATPQHLIASNPQGASGDADNAGPSQRPYETLTAVANRLRLRIDTSFSKENCDDMIKAALDLDGAVLIAWQHEDIPLVNKMGNPGLSQYLLSRTATPAGTLSVPSRWPKGAMGARYDLVFVFDRPSGSGPIQKFTAFAQQLLDGDEPAS